MGNKRTGEIDKKNTALAPRQQHNATQFKEQRSYDHGSDPIKLCINEQPAHAGGDRKYLEDVRRLFIETLWRLADVDRPAATT